MSGDGQALVRDRTLTVDECIDKCAELAAEVSPSRLDSSYCRGITWNGNLTSSIAGQTGNCFLKMTMEEQRVRKCGESCPVAASAMLIE
jgi:hypothetical protein